MALFCNRPPALTPLRAVDIVISLSGIGLRFLENNGTGFFTEKTTTWFPDLQARFGDAMSVAAADFNGDGAVRLALCGTIEGPVSAVFLR